jgi:hypothetical protein
MENQNELDVQEAVVAQEETTGDVTTEEMVSIPKSQFTKLQRRSKAYIAMKEEPETPQTPPSREKEAYTLNDEIVDLRLDGYSKQEVEFILRNGGRKELGNKDSYVAIALNTKREQERAEREANKVVDTSGMTDVERKYTTEQLKNMTAEELKKILPKA